MCCRRGFLQGELALVEVAGHLGAHAVRRRRAAEALRIVGVRVRAAASRRGRLALATRRFQRSPAICAGRLRRARRAVGWHRMRRTTAARSAGKQGRFMARWPRRRPRPRPRSSSRTPRARPSASRAGLPSLVASSSFISAMKRLGSAGDHLAAALAPAQRAHGQRALRARDAHVHQAALFLEPLRASLIVGCRRRRRSLNGSRPSLTPASIDVRPLQALGGVQRRQRDDVLVVAALGRG